MDGLNGKGREAIFLQLKEIIVEVIGADAAEIVGIHPRSAFLDDLGMDSIQIVAFAGKVNELYGSRIDFIAWLSRKPVRQLASLKVGDVAAYIADGKSTPGRSSNEHDRH
jgi:acyl carrier protein